ncbi:MAG: hypothetical protein DME99_08060 [Verrucomicrobia bacterium]|nr:MAG: hypothetical protein DME99_08060 [Verrucomicrobiota bacterium]
MKDAHSRRNCRHENGTEPWACCDCNCTKKLEEKLSEQGESFLQTRYVQRRTICRSPRRFGKPPLLVFSSRYQSQSSFVCDAEGGSFGLRRFRAKSTNTIRIKKS